MTKSGYKTYLEKQIEQLRSTGDKSPYSPAFYNGTPSPFAVKSNKSQSSARDSRWSNVKQFGGGFHNDTKEHAQQVGAQEEEKMEGIAFANDRDDSSHDSS